MNSVQTETQIQKQILDYLKDCPYVHVWRSNAGQVQKNVKLAPKGCPDIIGYITEVPLRPVWGHFIGFEVKQPGKLQTQDQQDWEADMDMAGALYFVVHSVEDVVDIIKGLFG